MGPGRRRRSRAEAEQLVREYEASGLSREAFCRQQGLSLATLARYQKRARQAQGEGTSTSRWVTVEASDSGGAMGSVAATGLAVVLPSARRLEVGRRFDAETLVRLLRLLESV